MARLKTVLPIVVRALLSALFLYSVACTLLGVQPPITPGSPAETFSRSLDATGYFVPLLKAAEFVAALALLRRRFVPLALVMLAPIVLNIAAFHLFLDRAGLPIAAFLIAGTIYLGVVHAPAFRTLLGPRRPADAPQQA
jgi:hypothetical protein